jgi:leucyl-tRNA synthetase
VSDDEPSPAELKVLHTLIGKEEEDIESFSFNTNISAFMIAVNELTELKTSSKKILEPLVVLLSPFAPHMAEELWHTALGHSDSVVYAEFPEYNEAFTIEDSVKYPISFNGKTRFLVDLPKDASPAEVEKTVRELPDTAKFVGDKTIVKVIVVPGRIVNIVLK